MKLVEFCHRGMGCISLFKRFILVHVPGIITLFWKCDPMCTPESTMEVKEGHLISSSITFQHIFWDSFFLNLKFTVSLDCLVSILLTVSATNTWVTERYSHARLSCGYCVFEVGLSGLYTKRLYKAKHPSDWKLNFICDKIGSILIIDNRCTISIFLVQTTLLLWNLLGDANKEWRTNFII